MTLSSIEIERAKNESGRREMRNPRCTFTTLPFDKFSRVRQLVGFGGLRCQIIAFLFFPIFASTNTFKVCHLRERADGRLT